MQHYLPSPLIASTQSELIIPNGHKGSGNSYAIHRVSLHGSLKFCHEYIPGNTTAWLPKELNWIESELNRKWIISHGVPFENLNIEPHSQNTRRISVCALMILLPCRIPDHPPFAPSAGVLISIYVLIPQGIHVLASVLGRRNLPIFLGPYQ